MKKWSQECEIIIDIKLFKAALNAAPSPIERRKSIYFIEL